MKISMKKYISIFMALAVVASSCDKKTGPASTAKCG
jgi:hypothetical protein